MNYLGVISTIDTEKRIASVYIQEINYLTASLKYAPSITDIRVNDTVIVAFIGQTLVDGFIIENLSRVTEPSGTMDYNNLINKPDSPVADIDDSVVKRHAHINKTILDTITQALIDAWNSAYNHISNVVMHITAAERTLWNTVTNKVDLVEGKGLSTEDYTTVEKNKLAGIDDNANNYVHPSNHPPSIITEDDTHRFFTDIERTKLNSIESGAEINNISDANATDLTDNGDTLLHFHSADRNRANHTGTQLAATISDFAATVRATVLTGLSTATNAAIVATDTILSAFGKLQKQISDNLTTLTNHTGNISNPHSVTKTQIGLGNADNTSDLNKPISTATQDALNNKVHINNEYSFVAISTGWYTIATASTSRAYGEFLVYDVDSSKHNIVKLIASSSYGQNNLMVEFSNRYSTVTYDKARILYCVSNRVYGGAKLQVYISNICTVRFRMLLDQLSGWDYWTPITPVLEDAPTDFTEDTTVTKTNIYDKKIHADLNGIADKAAALQTARSIVLTGDVTGSGSFDGSANLSITVTVVDDSHNHIISNIDNLQTALDGKASLTHTHTKSQITDMPTKLSQFENDIGAGGGVVIITADVAPSDPSPGDFWYQVQ